jgi:hypothetical protein
MFDIHPPPQGAVLPGYASRDVGLGVVMGSGGGENYQSMTNDYECFVLGVAPVLGAVHYRDTPCGQWNTVHPPRWL